MEGHVDDEREFRESMQYTEVSDRVKMQIALVSGSEPFAKECMRALRDAKIVFR